MEIAWIDIVILALIALSAIPSLFRGFVKEVLALATWLVALWIARMLYEPVAAMLVQWISETSVRNITAFVLVFICVLLIGAAINYLASSLVSKTGLSGTDKLLGLVFGVARGGVIVSLLVLLAGLTPLPHDSWWQESRFLDFFEQFALWMRMYLPDEIASNISFA